MAYSYITDNNFKNPQSYDYSAFEGIGFLQDYRMTRMQCISVNCGDCKLDKEMVFKNALEIFAQCRFDITKLKFVIKTFEVNKLLYGEYDEVFSITSNAYILKPNKDSSHTNIYNYLAFGLVLVESYQKTNDISLLSTLLKLNDILLSLGISGGGGNLQAQSESQQSREISYVITHLIQCEISMVENLLGVRMCDCKALYEKFCDVKIQSNDIVSSPAKSVVLQPDIAMIYSHSPRSKIYLQTLLSEGILPGFIVILGNEKDAILQEWLKRYHIPCSLIPTKNINDRICLESITSLKQKYVIYSGYGGGILCEEYFKMGKKFIHIHAGKLPQYKGSTTCYYSLLEENNICANAMFLNAQLDEGDIISEVCFSYKDIRKLKSTDIDTTIEPYIRAKALSKAMADYVRYGFFKVRKQGYGGRMFYKIHPVLKHIAILQCFGAIV